MMTLFVAFQLWFSLHPMMQGFALTLVGYLATHFATWAFKPRSQAERDRTAPALLALIDLACGVGGDAPKTAAALSALGRALFKKAP